MQQRDVLDIIQRFERELGTHLLRNIGFELVVDQPLAYLIVVNPSPKHRDPGRLVSCDHLALNGR